MLFSLISVWSFPSLLGEKSQSLFIPRLQFFDLWNDPRVSDPKTDKNSGTKRYLISPILRIVICYFFHCFLVFVNPKELREYFPIYTLRERLSYFPFACECAKKNNKSKGIVSLNVVNRMNLLSMMLCYYLIQFSLFSQLSYIYPYFGVSSNRCSSVVLVSAYEFMLSPWNSPYYFHCSCSNFLFSTKAN